MSAAAELYQALWRVGSGQPVDFLDCLPLDGDGRRVACIGVVHDRLGAAPRRPVLRIDRGGEPLELHPGPAKLLDRGPGGELAFAVDGEAGDRLIVLAPGGAPWVERTPNGRIEHLSFSPAGDAILMVVAGGDTDTITAAGSVRAVAASATDAPVARVHGARDDARRATILDLASGRIEALASPTGTIWEACWCGAATVALLWSEDRGESGWYRPTLLALDRRTGAARTLYRPADQLGHLRAAPDERYLAFVEGVASDRGIVAGRVMLVDLASGRLRAVSTDGIDISSLHWRDAARLHVAGLRGLASVVGDVAIADGSLSILWSSVEQACGGLLPVSRPIGSDRALLTLESFDRPPRPAIVSPDGVAALLPDPPATGAAAVVEGVRWTAPDGLEVEGVLIRPPASEGPTPLVIDVHGGPVWAWRAWWQGRLRAAPLLVARGIAVLLPNPRGSTGRGRDFAAAVLAANGGMGAGDADDLLSGIDALAERGLIDPARVGVTGTSYGGYMAALLPGLRPAIAAAAPISAVTDWFSQHLTSNMPVLERLFLSDDEPAVAARRYLERSPALTPRGARAPTLILAGELDRCVPIGQAHELHRALGERGVASVLVTYPGEGHSVRGPAGYLDSAERILAWFADHLLAPPEASCA